MKSFRHIILLMVLCCVVGIFCGCANSEKNCIKRENVQTSFPEWVDAIGLADNSSLLLQKYEEESSAIDVIIRISDGKTSGYQDVLELIRKHNAFVKDNPDYFNDNIEISIDVARGGSPVAEMAFLTNFGTLEDVASLGQENDASFSFVEFYPGVNSELLESGISFDFENVIVRQASGNSCNLEDGYKCLATCPSCRNVIVYIDGGDELTNGINHIRKYAESANVFVSKHGDGLESVE